MRVILFSILFLSLPCFLKAQSFGIFAEKDLVVKIWKDSKLIHHHTMIKGTILDIPDIGNGILIQFTSQNVLDGISLIDPNIKSPFFADSVYYNVYINNQLLEENKSWFRKMVGIKLDFWEKPNPNYVEKSKA
jgi:hypothetical protein